MIACLDVSYRDTGAIAACVLIADWKDAVPAAEYTSRIDSVPEYRPGEFYLRELPCILDVLKHVVLPLKILVVDGYVWLNADGRKGLGARLHDATDGKYPVIGVAKTRFKDLPAIELIRGESSSPLFVTAVGMDPKLAAENIHVMNGKYRIPTILKRVDTLCRTA